MLLLCECMTEFSFMSLFASLFQILIIFRCYDVVSFRFAVFILMTYMIYANILSCSLLRSLCCICGKVKLSSYCIHNGVKGQEPQRAVLLLLI